VLEFFDDLLLLVEFVGETLAEFLLLVADTLGSFFGVLKRGNAEKRIFKFLAGLCLLVLQSLGLFFELLDLVEEDVFCSSPPYNG
jgi:hypothetical protein